MILEKALLHAPMIAQNLSLQETAGTKLMMTEMENGTMIPLLAHPKETMDVMLELLQ